MSKKIVIVYLVVWLTLLSGCSYLIGNNRYPDSYPATENHYAGTDLKNEEIIKKLNIRDLSREKGRYAYPRWSPDGEKLAFRYKDNIWTMDMTNGKWEQWTIRNMSGDSLEWRGNEGIYYEDGLKDSIFLINLIKKREEVVIPGINVVYNFSVNPQNPKQLLVEIHEKERVWGQYIYDLEKNTRERLPINGFDSRWSPDGKSICYGTLEGMHIFDLVSQQSRLILKGKMFKVKKGEEEFETIAESISWSPDGKWIAFRGSSSAETQGIYIIPTDGSGQIDHIFNDGVSYLDWSPDGDKIAFTTIGSPGRTKLYMMVVPEKYRVK